jgi:hypothetical protein
MEIRNDFKELLDSFNKHKVEYLIVGSYQNRRVGPAPPLFFDRKASP